MSTVQECCKSVNEHHKMYTSLLIFSARTGGATKSAAQRQLQEPGTGPRAPKNPVHVTTC